MAVATGPHRPLNSARVDTVNVRKGEDDPRATSLLPASTSGLMAMSTADVYAFAHQVDVTGPTSMATLSASRKPCASAGVVDGNLPRRGEQCHRHRARFERKRHALERDFQSGPPSGKIGRSLTAGRRNPDTGWKDRAVIFLVLRKVRRFPDSSAVSLREQGNSLSITFWRGN